MSDKEDNQEHYRFMAEYYNELASMSKEDRLKFEKDVDDTVEKYYDSKNSKLRKRIIKLMADEEAKRNEIKRKFLEELMNKNMGDRVNG